MDVVKTNTGRTYKDVSKQWFEIHKGKIWITLEEWKTILLKRKAEKKKENPVVIEIGQAPQSGIQAENKGNKK